MKAFSLESHAALVTGSSQGIGHGIAVGIHEAGAQVILHGKSGPAPTTPASASFIELDLLADDAPARLVR
jgi:NAD(P)-dependent dehydrogenase (short-subunit alcohol dehydrogenase family)